MISSWGNMVPLSVFSSSMTAVGQLDEDGRRLDELQHVVGGLERGRHAGETELRHGGRQRMIAVALPVIDDQNLLHEPPRIRYKRGSLADLVHNPVAGKMFRRLGAVRDA